MKISTFWMLGVLCFFASCSSSKIEGLWVVEKVRVGEEEMTPVARWSKFNTDGTQTSGNGWVQHSYGTYFFDKNSKLSIENTNGFEDEFGPFSVAFENDGMTWKRTEEGMPVTVTLKKGKTIPVAPWDKLYGIWKLTEVTENEQDITEKYNPDDKRFLFLRWDKMYSIRNAPGGRVNGIYRVHGHRNSLELVNYGESSAFEFWDFEVSENELVLRRELNDDNIKVVKKYERRRRFDLKQ